MSSYIHRGRQLQQTLLRPKVVQRLAARYWALLHSPPMQGAGSCSKAIAP